MTLTRRGILHGITGFTVGTAACTGTVRDEASIFEIDDTDGGNQSPDDTEIQSPAIDVIPKAVTAVFSEDVDTNALRDALELQEYQAVVRKREAESTTKTSVTFTWVTATPQSIRNVFKDPRYHLSARPETVRAGVGPGLIEEIGSSIEQRAREATDGTVEDVETVVRYEDDQQMITTYGFDDVNPVHPISDVYEIHWVLQSRGDLETEPLLDRTHFDLQNGYETHRCCSDDNPPWPGLIVYLNESGKDVLRRKVSDDWDPAARSHLCSVIDGERLLRMGISEGFKDEVDSASWDGMLDMSVHTSDLIHLLELSRLPPISMKITLSQDR